MDFSDPRLIALLRDVNRAKQEHELAARLTGENFNVFTILGLSAAEVRTHSAFIAELLNPEGSHGQGAVYLKLFLKRLSDVESIANGKESAKIDAFQAEGAKVFKEYPIGAVNLEDGTGGRIDILLTDDHGNHIVIENKIYAADQPGQLLRYHNFCREKESATLYYLTLYGESPTELSTCKENFYTCISYKEHVLGWLNDCHQSSVSLPVVRESIFQYKCLIQKLTHQATGDKVKEDAMRIILANPDLADAVPVLWDAWQSILSAVKTKFYDHKQMEEIIRAQSYHVTDSVIIKRYIPDDCGGFVVAFRAEKGDGSPVEDPSRSQYADILRGMVRYYGNTTWWNVGYFNPEIFGRGIGIDSIPKSKILSLYENPSAMSEIVNPIQEETEEVTQNLRAAIRGLPHK
jgi:hypothetical protein